MRSMGKFVTGHLTMAIDGRVVGLAHAPHSAPPRPLLQNTLVSHPRLNTYVAVWLLAKRQLIPSPNHTLDHIALLRLGDNAEVSKSLFSRHRTVPE